MRNIISVSGPLLPILIFGAMLVCGSTKGPAQTVAFNRPESAIWSADAQAWFVSNTGGRQLLRYEEGSDPEIFVNGLSGPMGLAIYAETLLVANGADGDQHIYGYHLKTAEKVWEVEIPGAQQLNDLALGKRGRLYVTDRQAHRIYVIDIQTCFWGLLSKGIFTPNGLLYDDAADRLLVCNSEEKPAIYSLSLPGGYVRKLVDVPHGNLDGLGRDAQGRIYVSAWGKDWKQTKIFRYAPDLKGEPELIIENEKGAADIFVAPEKNCLALPNWWSNSLEIKRLDQ